MKRVMLSAIAAPVILGLLFGGFVLGAYIYREFHGPEWIATVFYLLLSWPLFIYEPLFGTHQGAFSDHEPNLSTLLATLLTDLLAFFLLAYSILSWRARRRRRLP